MARVYLETSFVSACVTDRTDAASIYRREASTDWWHSQQRLHEVFISPEVIRELEAPGFRRADQALALLAETALLPLDESVLGLARLLVKELVMPGPAAGGDAVHVATAIVHGMDYLLSWNVRHLANPNKLKHLRHLCVRAGLVPPAIITPDLLWESQS